MVTQGKKRGEYRPGLSNLASLLILGLTVFSGLSAWQNHSESKNPTRNDSVQNSTGKVIDQGELPTNITMEPLTSFTKTFDHLDFALTDKRGASLNYNGVSVTQLASLLSQYASTEAEKARIIYSWISYHIDYDVPAYLSGQYGDVTPEGVLRSRKGVCSGYATLYKALANAMGLEAVIISGYAKGASYIIGKATEINHAWNGVKIDQQWYLVDATWGAGVINNNQFQRHFNPFYFATAPDNFIYDHFPEEQKWQLLSQPYSKQQFDNTPEVSPAFFQQGLKFISHNTHTIQAHDTVEVVLGASQDTIATSRLKQGSQPLDKSSTFVQQQDGKIIVRATFPAPGSYELEIFAKPRQQQGSYPEAVTYKVIAKGGGKEFPLTYSTFNEKNVQLQVPLVKYLPKNQSVRFQLKVPHALEVQVIDQSSNGWTPLTASGNLFTGNVLVGSGKVHVVAQFPGDEKYWTLVEYN